MKLVKPTDSPIQEKFLTTRRELSAALIERDEEIDLVLTALIAQEHPLLVGPPGTAKSLLLDSLMQWMHGKKFTVLLTKFSTPEELFGPISVAGLKEDRYRRITTGKLPETDGAFIDEIFKASQRHPQHAPAAAQRARVRRRRWHARQGAAQDLRRGVE